MIDRPILGVTWDADPSAAIACCEGVIAYSEEERHVRIKHAPGLFPSNAIKSCLSVAGIAPGDIQAIALNWDIDAFENGTVADAYDRVRSAYDVDDATIQWQQANLQRRRWPAVRAKLDREWRALFPTVPLPRVMAAPHHYCHAAQAFFESSFQDALCLTIDGSGETECTVIWSCTSRGIRPIRRIEMPHSLGWFYAAITEYLGFRAYDGEYKVMGLAAYGGPDPQLQSALSKVLKVHEADGNYSIDPAYIHYGPHSFSGRFTDHLADLLGRLPRHPDAPIDRWHENLAYAAQESLENAVCSLVRWGFTQVDTRNVCVGGGVGLNVKMNSKIFEMPEVRDVFCHPLCSDTGGSAGAAVVASSRLHQVRPLPLRHLSLGHTECREHIEETLRQCGLEYESADDPSGRASELLSDGLIVGWFQGRMEAGPRALGHRSILADPRDTAMRDRVNGIIKYREYWRPFCPSMRAEDASRFLTRHTDAPFMIVAFEATDELAQIAPAVVHVDGTARVQLVNKAVAPEYHELLTKFGERTGVPVLLNTSFNVKGEPVVCTVRDALRTFWGTGLDALVIDRFVLLKPASRRSL